MTDAPAFSVAARKAPLLHLRGQKAGAQCAAWNTPKLLSPVI
jgi:hypothetical protein